jgi:DNA-binding SARP family transcriptional activator
MTGTLFVHVTGEKLGKLFTTPVFFRSLPGPDMIYEQTKISEKERCKKVGGNTAAGRHRLLRHFLLSGLLFIAITHAGIAQQYGLEFASFNVLKDNRTGLNLNPTEKFPLKKDLEISFLVNLYTPSQIFGYILRAIINDTLNIDIQANYDQNQKGLISVITSQHIYNFPKWEVNSVLNSWEKLSIAFDTKKKKLVFSKGGLKNEVNFNLPENGTVAFYFGAINSNRFITTDVPPMRIKDIQLTQNSDIIAHWPLKESQGTRAFDIVNRKEALVFNPHWLEPEFSQWKLNKRFVFKGLAIAVLNKKNESAYFLTKDSLLIYSLEKSQVKAIALKGEKQLIAPDSRLIFDELGNQIFYYNLDTKEFVRLDTLEYKWEKIIDTEALKKRDYTQHNGTYSSNDSSFYFFGGYGFYKYKNALFRYHIPSRTLTEVSLKGELLNPRYLASMYIVPGTDSLYILGGYGSVSGDQRINPQVFKNLYLINAKNGVSKKVCELKQLPDDNCFAQSFIIPPGGTSFYALTFTMHKYRSWLHLIRGNLRTGELVALGDSIPFLFEDVRSTVDYALFSQRNQFICLTSVFSENYDSTEFALYNIHFPPNVSVADGFPDKNTPSGKSLWVIVSLIIVAVAGLVYFIQKKARNKIRRPPKEPALLDLHFTAPIKEALHSQMIHRNSVFLLGEFKIFDKDGEEISNLFSPLLKELFLLIFFYSSNEHQGISSEMLNQILWFDKNSDQARNNRSVNMSKLRLNLSRLEGINLSKKNGYWYMEIHTGEIHVDYIAVSGYLNSNSIPAGKISDFLALTKRGPLLSETSYEWLDKIKSEFTNAILDVLLQFEKNTNNRDHDLNIRIADAIFVHDPLNEIAVKIKYNALIALGRHHLAKNVIEQFKSEYLSLYGEPFRENYT